MPTVEDIKIPYEILIRFGETGLPKGAHAQFIRRVSVDGEVLKEELGDAVPLDLAGFPTSTLMSDTARDALAEVGRLTDANASLDTRANAAESDLATARARLEEIEASLATQTAANEQLTSENTSAATRLSMLQGDLEAAKARGADLNTIALDRGADVERLTSDNSGLLTRIASLEGNLASSQQRVAELEAAVAAPADAAA